MDESMQSICSEGRVGDDGDEDGGVLDVSEGAPVDHGEVDDFEDEGDDCVGDTEAVEEVEVVNCIDQ